jgi:hypothetical protein
MSCARSSRDLGATMTDFADASPDEPLLSSALQRDIDSWRRTIAGRKPDADCLKLLDFATRSLLETLRIERSVHPDQAGRAQQAIWDVLYSMAEVMDIPADAAQAAFARGHSGNGHHAEPDLRADSRQLLPEAWSTATTRSEPAGGTPISVNWPDVGKGGRPIATCANARAAIQALGVECRYDAFHDRMRVDGNVIKQWSGELSDHACLVFRVRIREWFGFDPGKDHTNDAAIQLCLQGRFDPVLEYLDGLPWDGVSRLSTWLTQYFGARDTALNRKFSELTLIAAVRRVRQPGCKKDEILVLEGPEGKGKSTALAILAGENNFSDQTILGRDDREQQEAVAGIWIYEIGDLVGMSKAEVERTKAFASRTSDRARPAYGRHRIDQPRRCIFIATTNDDTYLKSQTGNRRFWPVRTGKLDVDAIRRDRDQLWAEAAHLEATGVPLSLPEEFWPDAAVEQEKRRDHDPWDDLLANVQGAISEDGTEERIATTDLMTIHLNLRTADKQTDAAAKRLSFCMARLGWTKPPNGFRIGGKLVRGYVKPVRPA